MKFLLDLNNSMKKNFEKGGRFEKLYPLFEANDTFLFTPDSVTKTASHVRDGLDLKRMMITVVVVSLFGEGLRSLLVRLRGPPRLFSRRTRRAVRIWRRAGVVGVAFLTPVLFSPIGGAILAASFRPKKRRLWPAMAASALCWGLLMSFVVGHMPHLFH